MAPEVINSSSVTSACDIWSLGCTILELLTGQPPYYKFNKVTAMFKIAKEGMPPLPNDISSELKDFLENCFIRDPGKRKTAAELSFHSWILQTNEGEGKANVTAELSESEQDKTVIPIVRPEHSNRGQKPNSKEAHNTHLVLRL